MKEAEEKKRKKAEEAREAKAGVETGKFSTESLNIRVTLTEPILGTAPANAQIYEDFVASKSELTGRDLADEIESLGLDKAVEKGMTVFHKDPQTGTPFLFDYQLLGFFKSAARALNRVSGTLSSQAKAYIKTIDQLVFVFPRHLEFDNISPEDIDVLQRPLRANTPQGERVSLACSEIIPAGAEFTAEIRYFNPKDRDLIIEWLNYGEFSGLGQWRNASYGRFTYEILD